MSLLRVELRDRVLGTSRNYIDRSVAAPGERVVLAYLERGAFLYGSLHQRDWASFGLRQAQRRESQGPNGRRCVYELPSTFTFLPCPLISDGVPHFQ